MMTRREFENLYFIKPYLKGLEYVQHGDTDLFCYVGCDSDAVLRANKVNLVWHTIVYSNSTSVKPEGATHICPYGYYCKYGSDGNLYRWFNESWFPWYAENLTLA